MGVYLSHEHVWESFVMDHIARKNTHANPISAELRCKRSDTGLISLFPVRRDLKFDLPPDRVTDWHGGCVQTTHLFNTISIITPLAERYVIEGLHQFRNSIDDADLIEKIDGLVAQEAIHTREHRRYNALLDQAGLPVEEVMRWWQTLFDVTRRTWVAPWFRLAAIMMLEHHTAAASSRLLKMPWFLEDSVEGYRELLTWHSLEEIEHKSVSFEAWEQVVKPGWRHYVYRTFTTLVISPPFWIAFYASLFRVLQMDKRSAKPLMGYWHLFMLMFGPRGLITSNAWVWIRYFLPGYHPWKEDNSEALACAMKALIKRRTAR